MWIFFPSHCPFYVLIKLFAFQSCLDSWLQSELSHGRAVLGQSEKPETFGTSGDSLQALLCACRCFWQMFTPRQHLCICLLGRCQMLV